MQDTLSKTPARGYYRSSSFKMAMLFTVLLGASVAVLYYVVRDLGQDRFNSAMQKAIRSEAHYLDPQLAKGEMPPELTEDAARRGRFYALYDKTGHFIAGNAPGLPMQAGSGQAAGVLAQFQLADGRDVMAQTHELQDGRRLMVGVDITHELDGYAKMKWLSFAAVGLMALVIFSSFVISIFVVSRTNRIASTARDIMETGNLSTRIEIDSRWDDLSNMAAVLNALLARVEELMQGVQQVSNNIAHDLRTPLTRLRNNLERLREDAVVAAAPRTQGLCDAMIGEADRLLGVFNALLRITRIETGREKHNFSSVALDALLGDVMELYDPLAEAKNIRLRASLSPVWLEADRDLLFQAFANMLDNAIKFSPAGGQVDITLPPARNGDIICRLRDTGPGIPPEEHEKVFERFYRGDSSRNTPGSGLGLSLVAAVIRLHGGDIALAAANPGLEITISLKNKDFLH